MTPRTAARVVVVICIVAAVGAAVFMLMAADDKTSADRRPSHPIRDSPRERDRVCEPLLSPNPGFGSFLARARKLAPAPRVQIGWYLEADDAVAKDRLRASLRQAGFTTRAGRFDGGSWGVRADRSVMLTRRAVGEQHRQLLRSAADRSTRMVLQVAYPPNGCTEEMP